MLMEMLEGKGFPVWNQLYSSNLYPLALWQDSICRQNTVKEDLASIVGAHYGRPVDDSNIIQNQRAHGSNYYQIEDSLHPLHQQWKNEQRPGA